MMIAIRRNTNVADEEEMGAMEEMAETRNVVMFQDPRDQQGQPEEV